MAVDGRERKFPQNWLNFFRANICCLQCKVGGRGGGWEMRIAETSEDWAISVFLHKAPPLLDWLEQESKSTRAQAPTWLTWATATDANPHKLLNHPLQSLNPAVWRSYWSLRYEYYIESYFWFREIFSEKSDTCGIYIHHWWSKCTFSEWRLAFINIKTLSLSRPDPDAPAPIQQPLLFESFQRDISSNFNWRTAPEMNWVKCLIFDILGTAPLPPLNCWWNNSEDYNWCYCIKYWLFKVGSNQ